MDYARTLVELIDRVLKLEDRVTELEQQLRHSPAAPEAGQPETAGLSFLDYLTTVKHMQLASAKARISNCNRVAAYEGDLDQHYANDRCAGLLQRLTYSRDDQTLGAPPRHSIPMQGDLYTGTGTLRMAVGHYIDYLDYLHR